MGSSKIPVSTAVIMSINIMLGAGLYAGVHRIAAVAGNAGFLGWVIVALLNLPIVYAIARTAALIQESGGFYRYAYNAFGKLTGFLNGWLYFIAYTCAVAAILGLFREDLIVKLPDLAIVQNFTIFSAVIITAIALLNMLPIATIGKVQKYLTMIKLLPVAILFILLPFFIKNGLSITSTEWVSVWKPKAWTMALLGFLGFEFACQLSQHIEGGARKTSHVMLIAFSIVATIYTLFTFGLLVIMGSENLTNFRASGYPLFIGTRFPSLVNPIALTVATSVAICFINSLNGLFTAAVAQVHSLIEANMIRGSKLLSVTNGSGRPWRLIILVAISVFLFGVFIANPEKLANATIFGIIGTYAITCLALLKTQITRKHIFGALATVVGFAMSTWFVYLQFMQIGTTFTSRILMVSPLLTGLAIGFLLINKTKIIRGSIT